MKRNIVFCCILVLFLGLAVSGAAAGTDESLNDEFTSDVLIADDNEVFYQNNQSLNNTLGAELNSENVSSTAADNQSDAYSSPDEYVVEDVSSGEIYQTADSTSDSVSQFIEENVVNVSDDEDDSSIVENESEAGNQTTDENTEDVLYSEDNASITDNESDVSDQSVDEDMLGGVLNDDNTSITDEESDVSNQKTDEITDVLLFDDNTSITENQFNISDGLTSSNTDNEIDLSLLALLQGDSGNKTGHIYIPPNDVELEEMRKAEDVATDAPFLLFSSESSRSAVPASYDLRNIGWIPTHVRNQDSYGTCWAFGAIASVESSVIRYGYESKDTVDLSELQLAYTFYNRKGITYETAISELSGLIGDNVYSLNKNYLNNGGNAAFTQSHLSSGIGIAPESAVPYTSAMSLLYSGLSSEYAVGHNSYVVSGVDTVYTANKNAVKTLLMEKGAGQVAYLNLDYKSAFFKGKETCVAYYQGMYDESYSDHEVVIVGWDDNFPASAFSNEWFGTPSGNGAWLIRNSWGSSWGDGGYFWLSYYDKSIKNTPVYFYDVVPADTYDTIYQYDGGISDTYYISKIEAHNVFIAKSDQMITHVSFANGKSGKEYTIRVVDSAGVTRSKISGTAKYAGYHTVELPNSVSVSKGESFSVYLTMDGIAVDVTYKYGNWLKTDSVTASGQSYYEKKDLSSLGECPRIKAFGADVNKVTDVVISGNTSVLTGRTTQLTAAITPLDATYSTVTWTSSDTNIATVSSSGLVTGKKAGTVTITAAANDGFGAKSTHTITVNNPVSMIKISGDTTVAEGSSIALKATVTPSTANQTVLWTSGNPLIASVDLDGKITGNNAGSVTITATAGDGSGVKGIYDILVTEPAESIIITGSSGIAKGKSITFSAEVSPDTALQSVTWTSSNPSIAAVDANGKVTGKKAGSATITATATDGTGVAANYPVTISDPVSKIVLSGSASVAKDMTIQLTASVTPGTAIQTIEWSSSNDAVAFVDEDGVVTGVSAGTATITATATDGTGVKGTLKIKVTEPVNSIEIIGSSGVAKGKTITLKAIVTPADAEQSVTWTSSNPSVASIDSKGVVKGLSAGTTTITAESIDGTEIADIHTVTVTEPVKKITIEGSAGVATGRNIALTATVEPADAEQSVTWTSSDKKIAAVDDDGVVTGMKAGSVTITATATDGTGVKGTYKVKVSEAVTDIVISGSPSVAEGFEIKLKASVSPSKAEQSVTWSSSDESIATVDSAGNVFGVSLGTVTITAAANDGTDVTDEYLIAVKEPVTEIVISGDANIAKGKSELLTAAVTPAEADQTVTWSTSKKDIAVVDEDGVVTGKKVGTAIITATANDGSGVKGTYTVKICDPVSSIKVSGPSVVAAGNSITLSSAVSPKTADQTVTWYSGDEGIAVVDDDGVVTGISAGDVVITATANDGAGKKGTYTIKVTEPATDIVISGSPVIAKGKSVTLSAVVNPADTAYQVVTWSTSDSKVATVDANGKVTGKKLGAVTITAAAVDGTRVNETYDVEVKNPVSKITVSGLFTSVGIGKNITLTVTVTPATAEQTIVWTSSNNDIAVVHTDGNVTGISAGTVTITAAATDGSSVKGTYKVKVCEPVTDITVSGPSGVAKGKTVTLKAEVSPVKVSEQSVTWSSNNTAVATVDTNGVVKGIGIGTAVITAESKDGTWIRESHTVHVTAPVKKVVVSGPSEVLKGESITLTAAVEPNGADTSVAWSTSDKKIATVDSDGEVTGVKSGSVTITATAKDGTGVKGTYKVKVK